ncbi:hypothetical protein S7711_09979 [Stachybotrys chartarum IBT 7711]|uniref:Glycosyltransferase family 34 protein n=1 Tax=Stachybotrys chartarum (strain CBS 109288 / IBT 7711) TaxID=1280523 RepID=A0A084AGS7_STACB|nr:hypothetical protein S7711_09979 [Stachybotrys chartarum IBT 7711]KFA45930.1 hypothetical protein S40293_09532 [Stachybotrys chartarum IBT 40293]
MDQSVVVDPDGSQRGTPAQLRCWWLLPDGSNTPRTSNDTGGRPKVARRPKCISHRHEQQVTAPPPATLASNEAPGGSSSSFSDRPVRSHHRRRSSGSTGQTLSEQRAGTSLKIDPRKATRPSTLTPIPGTPYSGMSLSRSPSPIPGGGWSSPGLNANSGGRLSPGGITGGPVAWESAKMRNSSANGYPSFSTQNQGFFTRHMRRISSSLPRFSSQPADGFEIKDKPSRSNWASQNIPLVSRIRAIFARMGRKLKIQLLVVLIILLAIIVFYNSPLVYYWRRSSWGGGGQRFLIVLAANVGGGVMEWKGAREWAIERDSVRNKRKYATRWGYDLEIVDMSTKKRYAHEWRESWEKVDFIRTSLRKYPKAEWVWWLDLNTYIMEPSYSLQSHIFNQLGEKAYRDINEYNPLNISHPLTDPYLDATALSAVGDGNPNSINIVLSQDCAGFNLGSFFVRRGAWTDQILDIWWDPIAYEQKHMQWEHKEQDALEQMYESQPWVRQHTGFLPQRMINSFPPAACGDGTGANHTRYHYHEEDRDFLVNMAGCEWGRDCWGEMYHYREFSYWLNRNPWERFKEDFVAVIWFHLTGQRIPATFVLIIGTHAYATLQTPKSYDNTYPRSFKDNIEKDQTIDLARKQRAIRAEAASQNGFETLGFYAAAVVAANHARLPVDLLNHATLAYVASRLLYTLSYVQFKPTPANSVLRSSVWWVGIGVTSYLWIKAGQVIM